MPTENVPTPEELEPHGYTRAYSDSGSADLTAGAYEQMTAAVESGQEWVEVDNRLGDPVFLRLSALWKIERTTHKGSARRDEINRVYEPVEEPANPWD